MKQKLIISLLLLFSMSAVAQRQSLMTYNIRHAAGMDDKVDVARTAEVMKKSGAKLIAVQEVDSVTKRVDNSYILGELALQLGMHAYFSPAIKFQGGKYGVGILSKEAALRTYGIPLPGREEARTMLIAEYEDYVFCSLHLSLTEADRMASLPIIRQVAASYKGVKPVFVAGDMNSTPDSPFFAELLETFDVLNDVRIPTCPADKPNIAIDFIVVAKDAHQKVKVKKSKVIAEPMASDHRPVVVKLKIKR